jgi:hypothetical protein
VQSPSTDCKVPSYSGHGAGSVPATAARAPTAAPPKANTRHAAKMHLTATFLNYGCDSHLITSMAMCGA